MNLRKEIVVVAVQVPRRKPNCGYLRATQLGRRIGEAADLEKQVSATCLSDVCAPVREVSWTLFDQPERRRAVARTCCPRSAAFQSLLFVGADSRAFLKYRLGKSNMALIYALSQGSARPKRRGP